MSCTKCILHKTCMSVKVPGRGSDVPEVMFIGQAPGREEDERGKCFVGPAGQLLLQAIKEYTLKPAYLTNAVKCFPPGDRDPKKEEILACRPYLEEEIRRLKPSLIVLLGNIPLKAMLGLSGITNYSGRVIEQDGQRYFPLLHPSYILRYPQNQAQFENHLKELRRVLHKEKVKDVETVQMSVSEAIDFIGSSELLAFDYETTGITPHSVGKVRCLGLSDGKIAGWVDASEPGFEELAKDFLLGPITKISHNSVFERRCSKENFGVYPLRLKWDTYAMHFLIDENSSHQLEVLAGRYLDAPQYDIAYEMEQSGQTYATIPMEKLGPYCAKDTLYTYQLHEIFRKELKKDKGLMKLYRRIARPLTDVVARMEVTGAFFDKKWASKLEEILKLEMGNLHDLFCKSNRKMLKRLGLYPNLNMNSSHQMRKVFVKGLKFVIFEKTKGRKESVKEDVIEKFRSKHISVPKYLDWKKKFTQLNNFVQKYPRFADEKGIIRASINPCFVVTGRLSVTKPPLQAVATDPRIRGMFSSRYKHGSIASCDFKQLEVRLVASESGETRLLKAISQGDDLHGLTASLLFGKGYSKDQRNEAKRVNFGVVYGITGYALALQINKTEDYSQGLIDKFFARYPNIKTWMEEQKDYVQKHGFIRSRFGRVRRLGDVKNLPDWQREAIERQAGNFPIQSAGADLTNLALIHLHRVFNGSLKSRIILQVHDSILCDVYPGEEELVKQAMIQVMSVDVPEMCPWLKVKLDVDFTIQERWEGMKWSELKTA